MTVYLMAPTSWHPVPVRYGVMVLFTWSSTNDYLFRLIKQAHRARNETALHCKIFAPDGCLFPDPLPRAPLALRGVPVLYTPGFMLCRYRVCRPQLQWRSPFG